MGALREKMVAEMKLSATSRRGRRSLTLRRWWGWPSTIGSSRIN